MTESENVALVRSVMEAYDRRDLEAMTPLLAEDVELVEWPNSPDAKTFHGRAAAGKAVAQWDEVWDELKSEVTEARDLGDGRVFITARTRARGKGSSVEVETNGWAIYTLRDGKVSRIQFFIDEDEAREALAGDQAATTSEERR